MLELKNKKINFRISLKTKCSGSRPSQIEIEIRDANSTTIITNHFIANAFIINLFFLSYIHSHQSNHANIKLQVYPPVHVFYIFFLTLFNIPLHRINNPPKLFLFLTMSLVFCKHFFYGFVFIFSLSFRS